MSDDSIVASMKVTVREFAVQLRGISPEMQDVEVAVLVEQLMEEHGIKVAEQVLLDMAQ